jgi:DNA-binding response OmpR family regulator
MLLVDSEAAIRFALTDYFTGLGFEVDAVGSLAEADLWLARNTYTVVLLDLQPGPGSRDGAERIRLLAPGAVICLLAPALSPEETREAMRVADLVITRPRPLADIAQVLFAALHTDPSPATDTASPQTHV